MKIRKLTALLLTLCMIFSLSVAAFAAEPEAHTIYDSAPDGEEGLAIHPFDAHDEAVLAVQLDCAAVHGGIDAEALHHEGVRRGVSVVHPEGRDMLAGEDGVAVAGIKPVIEVVIGGVRARDEALVGLHQGGKTADLHSSGRSFALFV